VVVVAASLAPQSIVSNGRNMIGKYKGQGQLMVLPFLGEEGQDAKVS
jgi:hypothetical protein